MAKGTFQVSVKRLLGLCLIIFSAVSCTYDYFEDETNFRLYVPQIENNEISRFCVVFHGTDGKHVRTRHVEAPFDKDDFMKQGILRFKLYPGEYTVSCFAEYEIGSITEGASFADSYASNESDSSRAEDNAYKPRNTNPRALILNSTVYPLGHPDAQIAVKANIDESKCYKGRVTTNFIDLPEIITRIDIAYKDLATKFKFGGTCDRFTSSDHILTSFNTAEITRGPSINPLTYTDLLKPSVGINFVDYLETKTTAGALSMTLEARFYNADNKLMGLASVSEADIPTLEPDKRPTDGSGNPVSKLILEPQKTLIFTFKGFTLFQVELKEWGAIVPGETTPM